jgi:hypothetical protein
MSVRHKEATCMILGIREFLTLIPLRRKNILPTASAMYSKGTVKIRQQDPVLLLQEQTT